MSKERYILVIADNSDEMNIALEYACARSKKTGRKIIIATFIEPPEVLTTKGVSEIMKEEAREDAEKMLKKAASFVKDKTGDLPALSIREGETISELKKLIDEEKTINVLVLAAKTDPNNKDPGPIITSLVTNEITNLRVPVMIVPGNFSIEHIAQITWSMSEEIAKILIDIESINFSFKNYFTLTSGLKSPVYVDCRKIISFPKERDIIINRSIEYLNKNNIDNEIIAGGETAGIPYAAFISQKLNKPMVYVRKKSKGFGINKQIEGQFIKNQSTLLVEDLATDGGSKVIFVNAIREVGLKVKDIFVIFYYDIFDYKKSELFKLDVNIHSLCTWKNILTYLENNKVYSNSEILSLKEFLNDPESWRKKNVWYSSC